MVLEQKRTNVLGVGVSAINMDEAVEILVQARGRGASGYVCVTGVHGVIESQRDPELKRIHNRSFLTVPDGMPTVWMGREQGFVHMGRVYGPDLMLALCDATAGVDGCSLMVDGGATADRENDGGQLMNDAEPSTTQQPNNPTAEKLSFTHFLYGSTPETLEKLKANLEKKFPGLRIAGTYSPPFRPLNDDEEKELQRIVAGCRPDFFWVGLSTPKQEKFMAAHAPFAQCDSVESCSLMGDGGSSVTNSQEPSTSAPMPSHPLECGIMLGVGAAFDIHAGLLRDAPEWIKNSGLQWFYRLCQEPRRLWRRYLDIVPKFLFLAALQLLGVRKYTLQK